MVEFAVVLVVLIPLLFAIIEFGYGYYVRLSLASAAREGGRWAVVRGAQSGRAANTAAVQAYVQSRTTLPVTAVVTPDGGSGNPGEVVQVVVNHATGRSSDSGCRRGRSATRHAWWSRTDRAPRITRDDDAGVATAQQMVWH